MPVRPSKRFNLDRRIVLIEPGDPVTEGITTTYPNRTYRLTRAAQIVADDKEDLRDDVLSTTQRRRFVIRWRPPSLAQGFPPTTRWSILTDPVLSDGAWSGDEWEVKSSNEIARRQWWEIVVERSL